MSPARCVTADKTLIIFVFCLELSGMGDYQATWPGPGFVGKSHLAPTGLGLTFVLGERLVPNGALQISSWLSLFTWKSPKEGPLELSMQMSSAPDGSWDGISEDRL